MPAQTQQCAAGKRPARHRDVPGHDHRGKAPRHTPSRQRLISAARELVEEHGYESLAVGQVWKRAGVSHRTFYSHFPDKRAVICAAEHPGLASIDGILREAQAEGQPWVAELQRSLDRALADLHGSRDTPRARLIAAMPKIAATEGIKAASARRLTKAAGVSATHLQHHFSDRYDCLSAAVAEAIGRLEERLHAVPRDDQPLSAVKQRLGTLIDSLAADPHAAALLLVEAGALSSPPHEGRDPADGPRGWAGSLRELVERRVLATLAEVPESQRGFAAGGIVAALRSVHLTRGREGLRRAVGGIATACLAPLVVGEQRAAAAGASAG